MERIGPLSATHRARSGARALSRTAIVSIIAAAGTALLALPASAHVTVSPGSAQSGSAAVLTFHVPNEEATADTTQVDIQIPTDHPIAQLLVQPVQGWTISVKTVTLAKPLVTDDGQFNQAVSEVIWSGGKVAPGQFQDFSVSADPLPDGVAQLAFKAIQTYSNGDVVRWIDLPQAGQPEPDHPAAVLTLTAGTAAGSGSGSAAAPTVTAAASGSDALARGVAFGGLACGLAALALAGFGWWRRRPGSVAADPAPPQPESEAQATPTAKSGATQADAGASTARNGGGRDAAQRKGAGSRQNTARR